MAIRNQNWYDLQAGRRYPLDETSTGEDDNGATIRDDILVDCHLRFPSTLGQCAFVQGITVAPNLVTVVFGAAADPVSTSATILASVTVPRPVAQNTHYDIVGVFPGVAGWLVFGPGIETPFVGRYSTPQQTLLAPRNARPYRPLPVTTLGKEQVATTLDGIIKFTALAPVTATYEIQNIDGSDTPAVVFRLEGEIEGQNPLQYFLGPCGQRPESGTCPKPPIETINGVIPDCDGNINLILDGLDGYEIRENVLRAGQSEAVWTCDGLDIITDIGLSEACNTGVTNSRKRRADKCNPSLGSDDQYWYNPIDKVPGTRPPDIQSSISLPEPDYSSVCATLPVCVNFIAGTARNFLVKDGLFVFDSREAPDACPEEASSVGLTDLPLTYSAHYTYATANIVGTNLAIYKNCASDWAAGHTVGVELLITTDGLNMNGGLVLNYLPGYEPLRIPTTYLVATIDADNSMLRLLRYNGSQFVTEYSARLKTYVNKWYRLSARAEIAGQAAVVHVTAASLDGVAPEVSFSVPIAQYGDPVGQAGLFSNQSYTHFNSFRILES
jgi:hypothetical protein